jgi:hypothetical protein
LSSQSGPQGNPQMWITAGRISIHPELGVAGNRWTAVLDCCMSFNVAGNYDPGTWPRPKFLLWSERYTVRRGFADEIAD